MEELRFKQHDATVLYVDNNAAISTCKNATLHKYTKPIGVRMSFLRETVGGGMFTPKFFGSRDNDADFFTKAPTTERYYRNLLNVMSE